MDIGCHIGIASCMEDGTILKVGVYVVMLILSLSLVHAYTLKMMEFEMEIPTFNPNHVEVVDNLPREESKTEFITKFDDDINFLNNQEQVRDLLDGLNYQRIGIIDSNLDEYTLLVGLDGFILGVVSGLQEPDTLIHANLDEVKRGVYGGDYQKVKDNLRLSLWLKIRMALLRVVLGDKI